MKRLLGLFLLLALVVPIVAQSTYTDDGSGISVVVPAGWTPVPVQDGLIVVSGDELAAIWFQWFNAQPGSTVDNCLQQIVDTFASGLNNVSNITQDSEAPNLASLEYENGNGFAMMTCNVIDSRILGILLATDNSTYDAYWQIMADIFDSASLVEETSQTAPAQPPVQAPPATASGNISIQVAPGWVISDQGDNFLLVIDSQQSGALLYVGYDQQAPGMTPVSCLNDFLAELGNAGIAGIQVTASEELDAETVYAEFTHTNNTVSGAASCQISSGMSYIRVLSVPNTLYEAYWSSMIDMLRTVQFPGDQAMTQQSTQVQPQTTNVDDPFAVLGGIAPVNVPQLPQGQPAVIESAPPVPVNISYTTWVDPIENAFAIEVPVSWTVDGGMYDVFGTKLPFYSLLSPDESILIFVGQTEILLSLQPSPAWEQAGYSEGTSVYADNSFYVRIASYRTGAQAAQEIVEANIAPLCEQFNITEVRDRQDSSGLTPDQSAYVSAGEVAYTCVIEGTPAVGYQYAVTYATIDPTYGEVWTIQDIFGFIAEAGREEEAIVALTHSMQSFTPNDQWLQAYQQQQQQIIQQAQAQMDDAAYYAMLSEISAMEHETTMAIIGNMGGDVTWEWEWEYDYGW